MKPAQSVGQHSGSSVICCWTIYRMTGLLFAWWTLGSPISNRGRLLADMMLMTTILLILNIWNFISFKYLNIWHFVILNMQFVKGCRPWYYCNRMPLPQNINSYLKLHRKMRAWMLVHERAQCKIHFTHYWIASHVFAGIPTRVLTNRQML